MKIEIKVHPSRVYWGGYDERTNQIVGKGDIASAYSADMIDHGRIRDPFEWNGSLMTCVGTGGLGCNIQAEGYKLTPLRMFMGEPTTYYKKGGDDHFESARNDPLGFYHGMTVKWRGEEYVLTGPPVKFVADATQPGPVKQMELI